IAAVKPDAQGNKAIRFTPEMYEKIYLEWMNNIHDWCISRQLWWPSHPRMALRYLPQDHRRAHRSGGLRPLRVERDHSGNRRSRHLVLVGIVARLRLRLAEPHP